MCGHGVCTCTCVPAFSVSFVAVSEQAMHTTRLIDCETVLTFKPLDDGVFITCVGNITTFLAAISTCVCI